MQFAENVCVCVCVCMVVARRAATIAKCVSAASLRIVCSQQTIICPQDRVRLYYIYIAARLCRINSKLL